MVLYEEEYKMKITIRVWILIFVLILAFIAIAPWKYFDSGVMIKSVEKNSTAYESGLRSGMTLTEINGQAIKTMEDYTKIVVEVFASNNSQKIIINTNKGEFIFLDNKLEISTASLPKNRLKTGLDLSGGARALVKAANASLTKDQVDDLVAITTERLNAFGLSDVVIKSVSDLSGENYMLIEIAGSTASELKELLESQGKFEAKIGNNSVFIGGDSDITYVGSSGQDAGIYSCDQNSQSYYCEFRFTISLSEKAAQRQADLTSNLSVNLSSGGKYLEKPLDLFVDDSLMDTLQIGADLKGRVTTQIQISGSGTGTSQQEAYDDAKKNMKKLQTILKTGSLPYKLDIVKLDTISPSLGKEFTKNLMTLGLIVFVIISVILFIKYRRIKVTGAVILTMFSEAFITLGIASLLKWNIDVAGIAGIIAGMGTGVNDQIVILDESFSGGETVTKLKERIKRALFVIVGAFFTIIAAMLPLFWAGAGILRGFALTTIIGVTVGILITRPAFADIVERIKGE
jgi:preprotein translocase subunit SecD